MDALFALLFLALALGAMVLWIWSIIDCATNEPNEGNEKVVWIIIIVVLGILGTLLYLALRRGDRERQRLAKLRTGGARISDQYGASPLDRP